MNPSSHPWTVAAQVEQRAFGTKIDFNKVETLTIADTLSDEKVVEIEAQDAHTDKIETYLDQEMFPNLRFDVVNKPEEGE